MPCQGKTVGDAGGSLDRLQDLAHLARQILDLLEAGQRLLVELPGGKEQQLCFGENRRKRVGQIVPQLGQRDLRISHQTRERYRSRRW